MALLVGKRYNLGLYAGAITWLYALNLAIIKGRQLDIVVKHTVRLRIGVDYEAASGGQLAPHIRKERELMEVALHKCHLCFQLRRGGTLPQTTLSSPSCRSASEKSIEPRIHPRR